MIALSATSKVFAYTGIADFRKGIDGLAAICRKEMGQNPQGGSIFLFMNRNRQAIKLLAYDGQGFWLFQKRLSRGRFAMRARQEKLLPRELLTLIWNGQMESAQFQENWIEV